MTGDTDDLDLPEEPIPVAVLTGFLGSGKTTQLNRLLAHPDMGETAVIVNEFGEIGLDHLLVESGGEDTVLLNSGCLCCTVRGDLIETMRRLFKRRARREVPAFTRLAVETTGLADPAPALLDAWPDGDRRSRLVFITRGLDRALFEDSLRAFNEPGPRDSATPG